LNDDECKITEEDEYGMTFFSESMFFISPKEKQQTEKDF